jgi:copper chaperone CopZ
MQDICTVTVDIPDMKNAECQQRIRSALQTAEGVMPNTISFGSNCVSVTYDSMKTAIKNIEFVIADAGFTANDIPANPTARAALPPECR